MVKDIIYIPETKYKEMYNWFNEGIFGTASLVKDLHDVGRVDLKRRDQTWMNNSVGVDDQNLKFLQKAKGDILIMGLGIGANLLLLNDYLDSDVIKSVDVIEIDSDVVGLISPYFTHPKIHIITGDALALVSTIDKRYDLVYWDIYLDNERHIEDNATNKTDGNRLLKAGGEIISWDRKIRIEDGVDVYG